MNGPEDKKRIDLDPEASKFGLGPLEDLTASYSFTREVKDLGSNQEQVVTFSVARVLTHNRPELGFIQSFKIVIEIKGGVRLSLAPPGVVSILSRPTDLDMQLVSEQELFLKKIANRIIADIGGRSWSEIVGEDSRSLDKLVAYFDQNSGVE